MKQICKYFGSHNLSPCKLVVILKSQSKTKHRGCSWVFLLQSEHTIWTSSCDAAIQNPLPFLAPSLIIHSVFAGNDPVKLKPLHMYVFQCVTSTESSKTWSCFTASGKMMARSRWTVRPKSSWEDSASTRSMNTHKHNGLYFQATLEAEK